MHSERRYRWMEKQKNLNRGIKNFFVFWFFSAGLSLFLGSVVFVSCAPSIKFQQLKPAKFDIGKEPSFVLGQVKISPQLDLVKPEGGGILGEIVGMTAEMVQAYFGSEDLRRKLEATMQSEIANNKFGSYKFQGAKYRIDFSGSFYVQDRSERKEEEIREGNAVRKEVYYEVVRSYEMELIYNLVRQDDGVVIGSSSHRKKEAEIQRGSSPMDAAKKFENWTKVGEKMIVSLVQNVMREILPYYETVKRKLRKGDSKELKEAVKLAEKGDLESAAQIWKKVLDNPEKYSREDRLAALYNLGVYYEVKDDTSSALQSYESCVKEFDDKWCKEGVKRTRDREQELKRLQQQTL
jgi:tetratricopeptide (TPR) repeat protein